MKRGHWTFLTNHAHVLVCLAADPDMVLRDVATRVGVTERAVQQIVADLEAAGLIARVRVGRRNRYVICREREFRHRLEAGVTVGEFLEIVSGDGARPDCRTSFPVSASSCEIATSFGCVLAEQRSTELARHSTPERRRPLA
jgi:DNA-binding IscR family transcriptional regulator